MKRNFLVICLIMLTFFVISFMTNILGALNPSVSSSYGLSETMAGFNPEITGANTVAYFWGLMTLGGVLGLFLLKILDSKIVLRWFTVLAMACLIFALFGSIEISLYAFPVSGFFLSVMYPIIISLALNSVDKHHGSFAGILMTGIMGGAVIQLLIGFISDFTSLKTGMLFLFIPLAYIFSISIWAEPLVKNKTINLKELFNKKVYI